MLIFNLRRIRLCNLGLQGETLLFHLMSFAVNIWLANFHLLVLIHHLRLMCCLSMCFFSKLSLIYDICLSLCSRYIFVLVCERFHEIRGSRYFTRSVQKLRKLFKFSGNVHSIKVFFIMSLSMSPTYIDSFKYAVCFV